MLRIAGYAFLSLFMVLVLGRYIGLPIFIVLIVSPSMVPAIYPGDMVLLSRSSFDVGDVVIWCSSALFCVVHRVIEINGSSVVTKGDANLVPDEPISAQAIKGKAIAVIPFGSFILIFIIAAACIAVIRCMGRSR
ncbi:MAG: signal peptidase I [Sulfolobales archaeon]